MKKKMNDEQLIRKLNRECQRVLSDISTSIDIAADYIKPHYKGKGSLYLAKAATRAEELETLIDHLSGCALDFERFFQEYMKEAKKIQESNNHKDLF